MANEDVRKKPARKALLVGINDYKGVGDLRGCVNDVLDMHFSLRSLFGFQTRDIRVLTDSRATKANIIHRLKWLVKGAQSGDFLVFDFSGHGSQIRDRDGDELVDHLDELICPYDMDWDGTFITDDELNGILKNVPEDGSYLPPPADIFLRFSGEEDEVKSRGFTKDFKKRGTKHHILWAGCMENQTSADAYIDGRYHGAFTYYLNRHLRRNPQVSRRELLRKVRASLRHGGYSQIPQLELEATKRDRAVIVDEKLE
ncbi:hypothetical protein ES703_89729 [subsurface metagenome]